MEPDMEAPELKYCAGQRFTSINGWRLTIIGTQRISRMFPYHQYLFRHDETTSNDTKQLFFSCTEKEIDDCLSLIEE